MMFMLNRRFTDLYMVNPYLETESETCMIVDHREAGHGDELLIVTDEGEFCWVDMDHVRGSPISFKEMKFERVVPDLPKLS